MTDAPTVRRTAPLLVLLLWAVAVAPAGAEVSTRVINGEAAAAGEYPWTVALVPGDSASFDAFCGGTLVAPDVVLTAAHCTIGADPGEIDVYAGEVALSDDRPAGPSAPPYYDVESVRLHVDALVPDDGSVPRSDLALLELAQPVAGAQVLPLATQADVDAMFAETAPDDVTVAGWGLTESGTLASTLRFATMDLVGDGACATAWAFPGDVLPADMICALRPAARTPPVYDSCNGDSGGPLSTVPADPSSAAGVKLVGVVSFGSPGCDDPARPGVYARVAAPALGAFVEAAIDGPTDNDPPEQLRETGGAPVLGPSAPVAGDVVTCSPGATTWSQAPQRVDRLIVRGDPVDGDVVATDGDYQTSSADVGSSLTCVVRASRDDAGGYGRAMSPRATVARAVVTPPPAPAPVAPDVPSDPPGPAPIVEPPAVLPPPPAEPVATPDASRPATRSVARRCTRRRVCTFTVTTADLPPSAGVAWLRARLTSRVRTRCATRRRACIRVRARAVKVKRIDATTFRVTTARLPRATHTLSVTAVDAAGNVQRTPRRVRFAVR